MEKYKILIISIAIVCVIALVSFAIQPNFYGYMSSDSFSQYDLFSSTCNNALGTPEGDCFVDAFEECKTARIKNHVNTVEGDPVFFYAQIILTDGCEIFFTVDDSLDAYGSGHLLDGAVCSDVRVSENRQNLEFLCDASGDWYGFPLS